MVDKEIVELFLKRNESALDKTKEKYGALMISVIRKALDNESDVEECFNDSLYAIWNSIPPNKPDRFDSYAVRIAKNRAVSKFRKNSSQKRSGEMAYVLDELDEIADDTDIEENLVKQELKKEIEAFLNSLPEFDRKLMIRRYWFMDSVEELSKKCHMSPHRVSVRLLRTRKKLKEYLCEKGLCEEERS